MGPGLRKRILKRDSEVQLRSSWPGRPDYISTLHTLLLLLLIKCLYDIWRPPCWFDYIILAQYSAYYWAMCIYYGTTCIIQSKLRNGNVLKHWWLHWNHIFLNFQKFQDKNLLYWKLLYSPVCENETKIHLGVGYPEVSPPKQVRHMRAFICFNTYLTWS